MKRFLLVLCVVAACGDDDGPKPEQTPDTGVTIPSSDAAVPVVDATAPDAASPVTDDKGIPLVLWVDDLVDHHTDDTSAPDTVDDKKIFDDENPTTFDSRF